MEWFVLGNEWDYSAVNPDSKGANQPQTSSNASGGIFGLQYSDYYNGTGAGNASAPMLNSSSDAALFNDIFNAEETATRNFFTGKLDGQLFAPMQFDYGSVYASMVFRTADRRQALFAWIYETAAGEI